MYTPETIERPFRDPAPERVQAFIDAVPQWRNDADDDPTRWDQERLVARRNELLQRQMGWLAEASAHYKKVFADAGIDAAEVRTTDDLVELPVTTKQDLMTDPKSFRLEGLSDAGLYDLTYATVYTTGTTMGFPTPYEYTTHDFFAVLLAAKRLGKLSYLVPGDRSLYTFPLSPLPHIAGFASMFTSAWGVSFKHAFTGFPYPEFPVHNPTTAVLDMIAQERPTVLVGIGSFLRRLLVEAVEAGTDLSTVRVVLASGEILTDRMKQHMRDNLSACGAPDVFIASHYGFTEGGMSFSPIYDDGPMYSSAPDQIYLEILDPDTNEPLPDGQSGVIALTHLNRRGMPLLRYLLGDMGTLTNEPDPKTGVAGQGLLLTAGSAHIQRTKELLNVKGTLVNPAIVHDIVMNLDGIAEYQMVVRHKDPDDSMSGDEIAIRIALEPGGPDPDAWLADNEAGLRERIRQGIEVSPVVEMVDDHTEIYHPHRDFKAQRVVDTRSFD